MSAPNIPLVLFTKAPVAGLVKTRLQPQCTADQCADIALILVNEALRKAYRFWPGQVLLAVWPDLQDTGLRRLADDYDVVMHKQADGDLGKKMHASFQNVGYPAAIMGCDAPDISADDLRLAHRYLTDGEEVIGPSIDGGYYLLGLCQPGPALFDGIQWGGDRVLDDTQARALADGRALKPLRTLNDIDTWQDLTASSLPALQTYLKTMQPG